MIIGNETLAVVDSALVPITSALPDRLLSQVMFEDNLPIDFSLGADDLIGIITYFLFNQGSGQEPFSDVSPMDSPLLPDIEAPKGIDSRHFTEITLPVKLSSSEWNWVYLEKIKNSFMHRNRQVIRTFVKRNASNPGKNGFHCGMHNKPGWLVKSVVYYEEQEGDNHCRDKNQLPLPEISTIQRLLSSADVGFGFNDLALENLGKVLANLKRYLRYGTLMWDTMSI
uniref:Uncharacterized protein n=1 Tax=Daphnia galeata TaxID=27404 RepID=A0A8J2RWU7_9CRUS|nr:unnamed protein product [Daphnia galeata]